MEWGVAEMTEKEKMLAGMYYNANDIQLVDDRARCKDLCHAFNQLKPSAIAEQQDVIRRLLGKTAESFTITAPFWCDYGYNIEVGRDFYVNHNCVILDVAKVTFGDHVFIAPNCGFYTAGHPLDPAVRNSGLEFGYPITIGNNVWIGGGVQVLPGVTIGHDTVIGAGSIVVKDIPDGVIAVGNPCRVIRAIDMDTKAGNIDLP